MKKIFILLVFIVLAFASCDKDEAQVEITTSSNSNLLIYSVKKLENPYSVSNMKAALASLHDEGLMKTQLNIVSTHLYVRFLPKDSTDLDLLMKDTTLVLFSYPLDYQLTEGEKYIDTTLIGNDFTWLYTKVPVGYVSPISGIEVLEELYLPMEVDSNFQQTLQQIVSSSTNDSWSILEERSLRLTGNFEEKATTLGMQKAKWWPKATIRVKDDITGTFIPLEGVIVRARWWFNWESGITNSNGIANMSGSFTGKLNWSIVWEGSHWDIRDGLYLQAYYNGPDGSISDWNFDIDGGISKQYAQVHRACWTMFYGDNMGTGCNSSNERFSFYSTNGSLKLSKYDSKGTGTNYGESWILYSPQISLHTKLINGSVRKSYEMYALTIHEIAHSMHINDFFLGLVQYAFVSPYIYESWAEACEWAVSNNEYKKLTGYDLTNRISDFDKQNWAILRSDPSKNYYNTNNSDKYYSPVFIDLVDAINQKGKSGSMYEAPNDDVVGFTLAEIRPLLTKTFTLTDLKNSIKKLRTNETILTNIDKLFETYEKAK